FGINDSHTSAGSQSGTYTPGFSAEGSAPSASLREAGLKTRVNAKTAQADSSASFTVDRRRPLLLIGSCVVFFSVGSFRNSAESLLHADFCREGETPE